MSAALLVFGYALASASGLVIAFAWLRHSADCHSPSAGARLA
jgi:hypothetical protein